MSQGTIVYVLASGAYSDREWHAVFTTEEAAQEALLASAASSGYRSKYDYRIEEHTLYTSCPKPVTVHRWSTVILDDGSFEPARKMTDIELPWDHLWGVPTKTMIRYVRAPIYQGHAGRLEVRGRELEMVERAHTHTLDEIRVVARSGRKPPEIKERPWVST